MEACLLKTGLVVVPLKVPCPVAAFSAPQKQMVRCSLRSGPPARRSTRSVATRVAVNEELNSAAVEEEEEESAFQPTEGGAPTPTAFEIQSLLMELCDETSIAELKLKVGGFKLHVKREIEGRSSAPAFIAPPVPSFPMAETIAAAPASAPASSAPAAPAAEAVDEGLLYVIAPKVGILRRGRLYKGKRGRNLVDVGANIKIGQVVCYVEQLGTQVAVESEHAGEVVAVLAEDGDPVGYGDQLVSIRPSFPGIKKLA